MIYYIILLFLIIFLYGILNLFKIKNRKLIFLKISFLILFLFLALRADTVGTDLTNYKTFFNLCGSYSLTRLLKLHEVGYVLYNYVFYSITNNFQLFLMVTAFFSLFGVYIFIKENSSNYFFSVLAYICLNYYFFTFSGLRQSISLSIILFSYKYIKEKKFLKFLICIFLAFMFHESSLVFLPMYFLKNIKFNQKKYPIYILTLVLIYIFRYRILEFLNIFFYSDYTFTLDSGYNLLLIYIIFFTILTMYKKILSKNEKNSDLWYNTFYIGIIIQIFSTLQGNAYRLAYYYSSSLIILLPLFLDCFDKKNRNLIKVLVSCMLIVYFIACLKNSSLVNEYSFFW